MDALAIARRARHGRERAATRRHACREAAWCARKGRTAREASACRRALRGRTGARRGCGLSANARIARAARIRAPMRACARYAAPAISRMRGAPHARGARPAPTLPGSGRPLGARRVRRAST